MAGEPDSAREGVSDPPIVLGVITGAHGVSGRVRVKPFTETPESLGDYGPVTVAGKARKLKVTGVAKGQAIAVLEGISDRNAAEALRGAELSVSRAALGELADPQEEGWFHADLIGLAVETAAGERLGTVTGVFDFGAGDLLEILPAAGGATVFMAFTQDNVPSVEIEAGRLVADPPLGTFETDEAKPPARKRRRSPKARQRETAKGRQDG